MIEDDLDEKCCTVCFRLLDTSQRIDALRRFASPGRCAEPGSFECRAVGQAVAEYRRENTVLRSNCDHLSSENAGLSGHFDDMAKHIEKSAAELSAAEQAIGQFFDWLDERSAEAGEPVAARAYRLAFGKLQQLLRGVPVGRKAG